MSVKSTLVSEFFSVGGLPARTCASYLCENSGIRTMRFWKGKLVDDFKGRPFATELVR